MKDEYLEGLLNLIKSKKNDDPKISYTALLHQKGLSEILILPISRGKRRKNENMRIFVISLWWYVSTRLLKSIIIFCKTSF